MLYKLLASHSLLHLSFLLKLNFYLFIYLLCNSSLPGQIQTAEVMGSGGKEQRWGDQTLAPRVVQGKEVGRSKVDRPAFC